MKPLAPFVVLALLGVAPAQVLTGDIAITGFSSSTFGVLSSGSLTPQPTSGFQGSGLGWSQTVLWDRANPNDFLVGGFGFVGRATVLGSGSVAYSLITNNVGIVSQMSWLGSGLVIFVDSGPSQVRILDVFGGAVLDVTTGTQPWGADASSGALDPVSGDYFVGGAGTIHRVSLQPLTVTPVASGLGGIVSGIAFDPATGEVVATVLTINRFVRVAADGTVSDIVPQGTLPGPNALDVAPSGDFVVGGGTGQVHRVPRTGGAPVLLGNYSGPLNGLAVAGGGGLGVPFGPTCSGVAGPVALTATGPFLVGSTMVTTSTNHAPNSFGVLLLGLSRSQHGSGAALPILLDPLFGTSGCWLNVSDDILIGGIGGGADPSQLVISLTLGPAVAGLEFYGQHVTFEAVAGGLSWSNGLLVRVP
ncbi:MAG: hypothetical protein JNK78_20485 [Planctomycetes bacterium]|nr:hypothetical protein [Planctomycetota bacterium]